MKKVILGVLLSVFALFSLYLYVGGFPIVLNNENQILVFEQINNQRFNPLENVVLNSGKNKILLLFTFDDINELPKGISKRKVLVCYDNEILKQLKDNFNFEISGGDMATVTSEIIVFKDDKVVLKTNFILEKNSIGIQSQKTGWAKATNTKELYKLFSQFKPYRKILLNLKNKT